MMSMNGTPHLLWPETRLVLPHRPPFSAKLQVYRSRASALLRHVKRNRLSVVEMILEPRGEERGSMDEHVAATVARPYKSVTLFRVVPFYSPIHLEHFLPTLIGGWQARVSSPRATCPSADIAGVSVNLRTPLKPRSA
jgi:hypothetical protein